MKSSNLSNLKMVITVFRHRKAAITEGPPRFSDPQMQSLSHHGRSFYKNWSSRFEKPPQIKEHPKVYGEGAPNQQNFPWGHEIGIYARISPASSTTDVSLNYRKGVLPISLSPPLKSPSVPVYVNRSYIFLPYFLHLSSLARILGKREEPGR